MPSITLRQIRRVAATGKVYLIFSDKEVREFDSAAQVREWALRTDDPNEIRELLKRLLLRWWLHRDPTGANQALVEGKEIVIDLSGTTLLEVR